VGPYKVVVTDQVFPTVDVETALLAEIDATLEVADATLDDVLRRGADADALLTTYFPIDADTIAALERCKIIARYGAGVDNVDIAAAEAKGMVVTNVPDYCVEEVAAHSLALLLSLLRKVAEGDRYVRNGGWKITALKPVRRISSLTIGQIGFGRIAQRLASTLRELGCTVIASDPYVSPGPDGPEMVSVEELLGRADAVLIHAPLTPETSGLIDAAKLELMQPHAVLVNTSRGGLVVLENLLEALRSDRIAGAALDVFDTEPLDTARIEGVPRLIVTPHMGYYSDEAIAESQTKASTQIIDVLAGREPTYRVRPV
jgi:D-3-phosphoglycerate dehydrogenase